MEKCFNCGAAVRPGAKFCTSCGTRLIDNPAPETPVWGQASSDGEAQVEAAATTPDIAPEATTEPEDEASNGSPFASWKHASSGWNTPAESSSPADRFEAALDSGDTSSATTAGWGAPMPKQEDEEDRFASWAAAYRTDDAVENTPEATASPGTDDATQDTGSVESVIITPERAPWDTNAPVPATDAAGFSNNGAREVDFLSGDESIATGDPGSVDASATPSPDVTGARERASTLIDELRSLVWSIGEASPSQAGDTTEIRNILSSVRGQTPDFSDLEGTIAAVRESPRDIDALRELGSQAERLEALFESHARLTGALDDAIRKLR